VRKASGAKRHQRQDRSSEYAAIAPPASNARRKTTAQAHQLKPTICQVDHLDHRHHA
jgi:hypothetical protein